ncbi:MAG TPA: RNA 2',3'-cyclic phosphodiesterase [Ignavibacteria bacterium]|nr:RNA 2',3'-cyclic phosphodiesterase [Ignavibacteria bacterium]
MIRAFLSLNLDADAKSRLKTLQNEVKEIMGPESSRCIKWENIHNSHITLFFLGDTEEKTADSIRAELREKITGAVGEIFLEYSGVSAFPGAKNPRVIIAALRSRDNKIYELNKNTADILDAYGFKQDKKFNPHLTLGRVRRESRVRLPDFSGIDFNLLLNFKELLFNKSVLSSKGAEHFILEKFRL